MTKPEVFFIIGVNGVGKSAIIPFLERLLKADHFYVENPIITNSHGRESLW